MNNRRLHYRTAPSASRGGFTLVELLVVIGIIAILAGVALGPITRGIKQAQESTALQQSHQLGALCFASYNDNAQVYPFDAASKSENIANNLLNGGYASDPGLFWVSGTSPLDAAGAKGTAPVAGAKWVLKASNVGWDFVQNGATTGLASNASTQTPLVQQVGGTATFAATGPIALTLDTKATAFGVDGVAVYYVGNNATFVKGLNAGGSTATCAGYVDASYTDANAAGYVITAP